MESKSGKLRWWQFGMRNIFNGMLLVAVFFAGYTLAATSNDERHADESYKTRRNPYSLNDWDAPPPPVVDPRP